MRVALLPAEDPRWSADLRHYRTSDGSPIQLFAALTGSERALGDLRSATTACLTSPLPARFRELLILRICAGTGCWSEWRVHLDLFAGAADISGKDLDEICSGPGPDRDPQDRLAIAVADAVLADPSLPLGTWRELCEAWGLEMALDSLMVAGQYLKVSWLANALGLNPQSREQPPGRAPEGGPRQ